MDYKDQRIIVLIDVQNLYYSARNLFHKKVNFRNILKTAVGKRKLIRAFAYVVKTKTGEEKPFFTALKNLGIETRVKELKEYWPGIKKADWDVGITIDAVRCSLNVDSIALCSGDGDFIPLVEYLQNQGKRVEIYAFSSTCSSELKEKADLFYDLEKNPEKFLLKRYA